MLENLKLIFEHVCLKENWLNKCMYRLVNLTFSLYYRAFPFSISLCAFSASLYYYFNVYLVHEAFYGFLILCNQIKVDKISTPGITSKVN